MLDNLALIKMWSGPLVPDADVGGGASPGRRGEGGEEIRFLLPV